METAENPPPGHEDQGIKEAAAEFIAARLELIRIEAREAGRLAARRGVLAGTLAGAATFAWGLVLAGLTGLLAESLHQPWYWIALGLAAIHLAVAVIAGIAVSRPLPKSFQTTRTELEKDREWLTELRHKLSGKR
jgi:uncharacterized membrane protein YqjE